MFRAFPLLLAAACAIPLAACDGEPDETAPIELAQPSEEALALAKAVQPEDVYLADARRGFAAGLRAQLAQPTPLATYERRYPGIADAYLEEGWEILSPAIAERMPELWNELARIYDNRLEPAEIDAVLRFFRSPTGQKYVRLVNSTNDPDRVQQRIEENGIDERFMMEQGQENVSNALAELSDAEIAQLSAFEREHAMTFQKLGSAPMGVLQSHANAGVGVETRAELDSLLSEMVAQRSGAAN